jgi:ATP-dependent Clp protease ATP-binding subunit ClpC
VNGTFDFGRETDPGKAETTMYERFTERARKVLYLSQQEAKRLGHNYVGTEHLLLGLVAEGEGVAATALQSLEISLQKVRSEVERIIGASEAPYLGDVALTPRAKRVLELALDEGRQLGHN